MSGVELAACPFCGSEPSVSPYQVDAETEKWAVACDCSNAPEDQPYAERYVNVHGHSQADAIAAWNRRAAPMEAVAWREKVAKWSEEIDAITWSINTSALDSLISEMRLALIPQAEET